MSGIGHLAAGFSAKPIIPEVPLWVLLVAGETNDLLYFFFSSIGMESKAVFTMDFVHGVRYLTQTANPWSHGLVMSMVWSIAAAYVAYLFYRKLRTAGVVGLVVFSHWILDFLMHPNLPLLLGDTPLLGLGLENSGIGFLFMTFIDLLLLGSGIVLYAKTRVRKPVFIQEDVKQYE